MLTELLKSTEFNQSGDDVGFGGGADDDADVSQSGGLRSYSVFKKLWQCV